MKKLLSLVVVAIIVIAGIIFVPKLVHTCDDCGKTFVGAGYEPFALVEMVSEEEQIICKECAEEQHALEIGLGKSVDDYKKDLF